VQQPRGHLGGGRAGGGRGGQWPGGWLGRAGGPGDGPAVWRRRGARFCGTPNKRGAGCPGPSVRLLGRYSLHTCCACSGVSTQQMLGSMSVALATAGWASVAGLAAPGAGNACAPLPPLPREGCWLEGHWLVALLPLWWPLLL
jgi:hypothetical protein